jgi:hypothetical protein
MSDLWNDDLLQFTRLLEELQAAGALNVEVIATVAESMDLEPKQVHELLERAQVLYDGFKVTTCPTKQFTEVIANISSDDGVYDFDLDISDWLARQDDPTLLDLMWNPSCSFQSDVVYQCFAVQHPVGIKMDEHMGKIGEGYSVRVDDEQLAQFIKNHRPDLVVDFD